jgi:hypothetical protein
MAPCELSSAAVCEEVACVYEIVSCYQSHMQSLHSRDLGVCGTQFEVRTWLCPTHTGVITTLQQLQNDSTVDPMQAHQYMLEVLSGLRSQRYDLDLWWCLSHWQAGLSSTSCVSTAIHP